MWSILILRINFLLLIALTFPAVSFSAECRLDVDSSAPVVRGREQLSSVCAINADGGVRNLQLAFNMDRSEIYLKLAKKRTILEKIGAALDPRLIGSVDRIRFLPTALQAYRSQGVVLFVSSRRSVAGNGGGQCGSGSEDYLNALDVNGGPPRVLTRVLIGSCLDNVELSDASNFEAFKSFWVDDGVLAMQFLSYDDRCEEKLTAKLDIAARRLRFFPSRHGLDN
jgi:hypothetical protein